MNKELQNKAWSVLPKEFKEEVKKLYREFAFTREGYYVELFGLHNLTSDAEGEEMLMVPRSQMQKLYASTKKVNDPSSKDYINGILNTLNTLFGSKCLPDESVSEVASETKSETDKHFDNIPKDGFRSERRLNIAAMAMQGILSNPQLLKIAIETYQEEIGSPDIYVAVAKTAKAQADALIAECEQTEKLKEN